MVTRTPVAQYDKNGVLVATYPSVTAAAKVLGCVPSNISQVFGPGKHYNNKVYGFYFKKIENEVKQIIDIPKTIAVVKRQTKLQEKAKVYMLKHAIEQYNVSGTLIAIHDTAADAARSVGVSKQALNQALNNSKAKCRGFIWKRLEQI